MLHKNIAIDILGNNRDDIDVRATTNTVIWDDSPDCTETSPSINAPTILKV